jgi:DNA mismatch endonuclease, patch repair protein
MDRLTAEARSRLMSRVRSRDTKPEMAVRSVLHSLGYRYKLHVPTLPGKPDIVFPSRRKVILVHGCYWHGHSCKYGRAVSKSNVVFWTQKIETNRRRDDLNLRRLRAENWSVHVIWECRIKRDAWLARTLDFLEAFSH